MAPWIQRLALHPPTTTSATPSQDGAPWDTPAVFRCYAIFTTATTSDDVIERHRKFHDDVTTGVAFATATRSRSLTETLLGALDLEHVGDVIIRGGGGAGEAAHATWWQRWVVGRQTMVVRVRYNKAKGLKRGNPKAFKGLYIMWSQKQKQPLGFTRFAVEVCNLLNTGEADCTLSQ